MARSPKVRKPKKADEIDDDKVDVDDDENNEDVKEEEEVDYSTSSFKSEPLKESPPEPVADVTLKECASLSRAGKTYIKDRSFIIVGEGKIKYFESDVRFRVIRRK